MLRRTLIGTFLFGVVVGNLVLRQATAQNFISTIALTGQQAADLPAGVQYNYFSSGGSYVLNSTGQVAFEAYLMGAGVTTNYDRGIWMGTSGVIKLLARTGDPAPETAPGVAFSEVYLPKLFADGQTMFQGNLTGPGVTAANRTGYWQGRPGDLRLIARNGDAAPGTSEGVTFSYLNLWNYNSQGQALFLAKLTGPGVTSENDFGLWLLEENGMTPVARKGDQAAGAPAGVKYAFGINTNGYPNGNFLATELDDSGRVAFFTDLSGPGLTSGNNVGMWLSDSGATTLIARQGNPAPGAASGQVYSLYQTGSNELTQPVLNAAGQIAFSARLTGPGVTDYNNAVIMLGTPDNLAIRVRDGQIAPGTGLNFTHLESPQLNDAGEIAFVGHVEPSTISNYLGLWLVSPDGSRLIARQGQIAPGTGGLRYNQGLQFARDSLSVNAAGQVAFWSAVATGGGLDSLGNGFWVDDGGQLTRIVGSGNIVAGRSVANITDALRRSYFNDLGQLAFNAMFVDGGSGLFLYGPPLPGDFNANGAVDAADLAQWRGDFGVNALSDADGDGDSDGADFLAWQQQFGSVPAVVPAADAVPEPATSFLFILAAAGIRRMDGRMRQELVNA